MKNYWKRTTGARAGTSPRPVQDSTTYRSREPGRPQGSPLLYTKTGKRRSI